MAVGDGVGLIFKIRGDSSGLASDFTTARATITTEAGKIGSVATNGFGQVTKAAEGASKSLMGVKSEASSLTSELKGMAGSMTVALGGVTALVGGLIAVSREINKLSQEAIEAGSHFHDLSIQTGLTVETLSGLESQLKQSGTTVDQLNNGVFFLQKNLRAAAEGNKELQSTFARLGIKDANAALSDMEGTLRKVLKGLSDNTNEAKRNTDGAQVMGKAYKDLRVFVSDLNGEVDGAIDKAKKLGLVMSGEAADAADRLGDKIDEMRLRIERLRIEVGGRFVTSTENALLTIDQILDKNAQKWEEYAGTVGSAIFHLMDIARLAVNGPTHTLGGIGQSAIEAAMGATKTGARSEPDFEPKAGRGKRARKPTDDKGRSDIQAIEEENRAIVEEMRASREKLKEEFDKGNTDLNDYYDTALAELKTYTLQQAANFDREKVVATQRIKNADELQKKLKEIGDRKKKADDESDKERRKLEDDRDKDLNQEAVNDLKRLDETTKFFEERRLKLAETYMGESELEEFRYKQKVDQSNRQKEILKEELKNYGEYSDKYLEILHLLNLEDSKQIVAKEEYLKKLSDIIVRQNEFFNKRPEGIEDSLRARGDIAEQMNKAMGGEKPPVMFDGLKTALTELKNIGLDAFQGLAQGFGTMIGAWASGANLGEHAMAKLVSSVLAGVAAQAATQAILFTAYGIAALTPWGAAIYGPASQWFIAAGLMASIAATSAVLGRAIAPKEAGKASAGASVPSSGSSGGTSSPQPVIAGRTTGGGNSRTDAVLEKLARAVDRLTAVSPGSVLMAGAKESPHAITNTLRDDFRLNGVTRQIVVDQMA